MLENGAEVPEPSNFVLMLTLADALVMLPRQVRDTSAEGVRSGRSPGTPRQNAVPSARIASPLHCTYRSILQAPRGPAVSGTEAEFD